MPNLNRYLEAQTTDYQTALAEVKNGRKRSHWMWYIFPQIQGLGFSETSRFYAIRDAAEAQEFLQHPVLGRRLVAISQELLAIRASNASAVFGSPDDVKLQSSMTLFGALPETNPVFQLVLDKFFGGLQDANTLQRLAS